MDANGPGIGRGRPEWADRTDPRGFRNAGMSGLRFSVFSASQGWPEVAGPSSRGAKPFPDLPQCALRVLPGELLGSTQSQFFYGRMLWSYAVAGVFFGQWRVLCPQTDQRSYSCSTCFRLKPGSSANLCNTTWGSAGTAHLDYFDP